jgi:hypothetical protein
VIDPAAADGKITREEAQMARHRLFTVSVLAAVVVLTASFTPLLAQQIVHVETAVTNITSTNFIYGPVGPDCSATSGGPGCKFVSFDFSGTCKTVVEGGDGASRNCKLSGSPTVLFSFSPSGPHDANGNPTGVCAPFVETLTAEYRDGSTLEATGQGTVCCAGNTCSGGFGPPFVTHESTIITGGTGALAGVRGSGLETGAGYPDGSEIAQQEQVWLLPGSSLQAPAGRRRQ